MGEYDRLLYAIAAVQTAHKPVISFRVVDSRLRLSNINVIYAAAAGFTLCVMQIFVSVHEYFRQLFACCNVFRAVLSSLYFYTGSKMRNLESIFASEALRFPSGEQHIENPKNRSGSVDDCSQ